MVKLILTGYPTLQDAIKAANKGADGFILKPINIDYLLDMIAERLKKQQEEKEYSQEKIEEYIETRAKELSLL
jgi:DNA-binding NtrC family response regulator